MTARVSSSWHHHPGGFNAGLLTYALAGVTGIVGAALLLIAAAAALVHGDQWQTFAAVGLASAVPGLALSAAARPPRSSFVIRSRDIFLTVTLCWLVAALVGAIPVYLAGDARSFVAAYFEAMSGYTTTGATIFDDIDALPPSVLLWRSMMQWFGGIGIVVLLVGIAPALGAGSVRALFAELAGPTKERYTPRIADTARALVRIYLVLTLACVASYLVTGLNTFDAVNHAMTTVSTGGFSTHTASLAHFGTTGPLLVAIVFMILGGVNFGLFILLAMRRRPSQTQRYELVSYLATLAAFSGIVAASLTASGDLAAGPAALHAAFSVVSVITTTGYTTVDFDLWNETARTVMLAIMFVGGSAGSTVGGIKIVRWMILTVAIRSEFRRLLHPSAVVSVRVGNRRFGDRDVLTLLAFIASYAAVFAVAAVVLAAVSDLDLVSALSASAATINLVGPALGLVGAAESYSVVSDTGLAVLTLNMLLGRLEIFTVLVLLIPAFWRRR